MNFSRTVTNLQPGQPATVPWVSIREESDRDFEGNVHIVVPARPRLIEAGSGRRHVDVALLRAKAGAFR